MGARTTGLAVTGVGTGAVSAVCAIASYRHIAHLATSVGQGQLAMWLPLGIDGLVISSTASILTDRHGGCNVGLSARLGLGLGLAASLAANLVAVDPTLVSERAVRLVLAGYPPVALAIAGHVLMTMLLGAPASAPRSTLATPRGTAGDAGDTRPGDAPGHPGAHVPSTPGSRPSRAPKLELVPRGKRPAELADVTEVVADLLGAGQGTPQRTVAGALRNRGLAVPNNELGALIAQARRGLTEQQVGGER